MPSGPVLPFFDDLLKTLAEAWRLLERGVSDRRHAFHHPVLATIDGDGRPQVRTVILRGVDPATREIIFHTDARSDKLVDLAANRKSALHVYDERCRIQLRLNGDASVHQGDGMALSYWQASQRSSRVLYSTDPAPGVAIAHGGGFTLRQPVTAESEAEIPGFENFAVVVVRLDSLEWLFLGDEGHRRARFTWADGASPEPTLLATWLAP